MSRVNSDDDNMPSSKVPVPDPTKLTTDAVNAATAQWRLEQTALRELLEALISNTVEKLVALEHIHDEKFSSIAQQFVERDVRTTQASSAADDALKAALQAAKELVGAQGEASAAAAVKSETSFTKQIDQIGTIIQTLEKALDARITELKERIDRGEGASQGQQVSRTDFRGNSQLGIAAFSALLVVISIAIAIVVAVSK